MAGFDPNQPRDEEGKWTKAGRAASSASLSSNAEKEFELFNTYAQRWTSGIDADSRAVAFSLAMNNKELHEYLLQQQYGSDRPKYMTVYRVGNIDYYDESGIVSLFATLEAAQRYQQRFDVDTIREFQVPTSRIVPALTGAGEVWVERDWLE